MFGPGGLACKGEGLGSEGLNEVTECPQKYSNKMCVCVGGGCLSLFILDKWRSSRLKSVLALGGSCSLNADMKNLSELHLNVSLPPVTAGYTHTPKGE